MAFSFSTFDNLRQLFLQQLDSLYDGEHRIGRALPELIAKASSAELKTVLQNDLEVVRRQIGRLNRIFGDLGHQPGGEPNSGIEALINEGDSLLARCRSEALTDTCILLAAHRLEHCEIAGYGSLMSFAHQLGWANLGRILEQCLREEREAERKFTGLSETLSRRARTAA
jgi:ferritin-like metal-binding protein YciE